VKDKNSSLKFIESETEVINHLK